MTLYSVSRGQWIYSLFKITPFCTEWRWCVNSFRPSVTHICDNELCHYWFTDDGLSPIRCQACNETMIYCQLGTHSENSSTIMHLKMSSAKYRSFFSASMSQGLSCYIIVMTRLQEDGAITIVLSNHPPWCRIYEYEIFIAYMRQWLGSTLVQIIVCRLFGAKPLSKPMVGYCQMDP